ncbi:ATP-dependent helicase [Corynebacterium uterequi]|uniref:DNA 3'-5' helicase n=1 Tax=Corynebacterium uterequi TaxID=1072256 RepID=A0A0G3HH88_9CORY|nr:UvrD-helicase domain-containing protein [Corynebacterium uterequi]AKK10547.1 DNA/RNA helicase, superfamily I [Corynebacterium uterequi]
MPSQISPQLLSQVLFGGERVPTDQQADVIATGMEPLLVVAGAGAGKTETMATRVVWLVANGYVDPDQVLGLTFTRKAAQQLGQRFRKQFGLLAGSPKLRDLDPSGELAHKLQTQQPTAMTYDSYANQLVKEFGLLAPVEPSVRIITDAELYGIAHELVRSFRGTISGGRSPATITERLIELMKKFNSELVDRDEVAELTRVFRDTLLESPLARKRKGATHLKDIEKWIKAQQQRLELLPLVADLEAELAARGVATFDQLMASAARLTLHHPRVAESQRSRYRVVMLDEYQDTSHTQRILLSHLFGSAGAAGTSVAVTAVGDPMQSIYRFRGASMDNLAKFVEDFQTRDATGKLRPAQRKELTTSWRNPVRVLAAANTVSEGLFRDQRQRQLAAGDGALGTGEFVRPVGELESRDGAPDGDVSFHFFPSREAEISALVERMDSEYRACTDAGRTLSAAVLVRKNSHAAPISEALSERGIPNEVVGVAGLLAIPEVADLVALATMLIRPGHNAAALRILAGPLVGLGTADLLAVQRRARNLIGQPEREPVAADPLERLRQELAEVTAAPPEHLAGLTDAVADLGEPENYSEQGYARLYELSARLRRLRTYSLGKPLTDLFADIEAEFGLRTEVLSRPGVNALVGAVHLDKFAEVVGTFQGGSLGALLDYLELARQHEGGLESGEITAAEDRVQILTIHKSKGLEWDVLAVVHANKSTFKAQGSTFLTQPALVPSEDDLLEGDNQTELKNSGEALISEDRMDEEEEAQRLFYVALTRAKQALWVSGSGDPSKSERTRKDQVPYEPFDNLVNQHPDLRGTWQLTADTDGDAEAVARPAPEGTFPAYRVDDDVARGATDVYKALARLANGDNEAAAPGETFEFWEREVDALIEEHRALATPEVTVSLPGELTATDLVSLRTDPAEFARRLRRPVPFKPNTFAKRGTAFHEWLERRAQGQALLDADELPGVGDDPVSADELAELKATFLGSEWAQRVPSFVEHPFVLSLGRHMVRGRMDAVFAQPDGSWLVLDWKTGQQPSTARARRDVEIQLAVYREAWRRIADDGMPVAAAFYYVRSDHTFAPSTLPDGEDLVRLLDEAGDSGEPDGH